jgi:hypothetical protein
MNFLPSQILNLMHNAKRPQTNSIININNMRIAFTLIATFLLAFGQSNIYGQKKFELADYGKLVNISDPQISPDGKSVVVVVSRPDYVNNRFNAELVMVDVASGKRRVLTQDKFAVSSPRWSPNGEQLGFISRVGQGKDALNQSFYSQCKVGRQSRLPKQRRVCNILHGAQILKQLLMQPSMNLKINQKLKKVLRVLK